MSLPFCPQLKQQCLNLELRCHKLINNTIIDICSELLGKFWISDQIVFKYLETLTRNMTSESCLIIDPIIRHAVKCLQDYAQFLDNIHFNNKKIIIAPINNSQLLDKQGGSHWSVLMLDCQAKICYYYDSYKNLNVKDAMNFKEKLTNYLSMESSEVSFKIMDMIQQENSYDCALFTIYAVEYLLFDMATLGKSNFYDIAKSLKLSEVDLIRKRSMIAYVLNSQMGISKTFFHSMLLNDRRSFERENRDVQAKLTDCEKNLKEAEQQILDLRTYLHTREGKIRSDKPVYQEHLNLPVCANKLFEVANDSTKASLLKRHYEVYLVEKTKKCKERNKTKPKITIMADSQGKDLYLPLDNLLGDHYHIYSHFQPGAPIETILESATAHNEIKEYTKEDYLIVIGGCNNIANNIFNQQTLSTTKFLKHLQDQMEVFSHTNVILATIPYRYDLQQGSWENQVIKDVNNGIRRLVNIYPHVKLLDLHLLQSCHHTRHGLHIGRRGKKYVSS